MFNWEAMFSQWAIKRICKFVLKKKLGDYILGDIDLDQLDVQLRQGTIQLNDLALNVDYINLKLGDAPVIVKEGSIASLSIRIPWKMKKCQIEVEELELVLAPCLYNSGSVASGTHITGDGGKPVANSSERFGEEKAHSSVPADVHEGVKTIARIVKLFLTSFHVRLKNLIVAFDPGSKEDAKPNICRNLVLRIAETEYGTCVSEDKIPIADSKCESVFGMAKLTNFIKFQGAVLEFVEMNEVDSQQQVSCCLERNFSEFCPESSQPQGCTAKILGGPSGGFSGTLNLSIPWKYGCLDIQKLHADIAIDPVQLTLQRGTIIWIISLWESLKNVTRDGTTHGHAKTMDSIHLKCRPRGHSATVGSSLLASDILTPSKGSLVFDSSLYSQEALSGALLPGTHVIHNWVPSVIDSGDNFEADSDYGASIDQFFECFDGMRSSQSVLGNSGIWNWTCSVFSAITAASNLASGCGHVPSERQNVETNMRATVAAFSIILSFHDEPKYTCQLVEKYHHMNDMYGTQYKSFSSAGMAEPLLSSPGFQSCMSSLTFTDPEQLNEQASSGADMHLLNIRCLDLTLIFQIFAQCTKFGATVKHISIDDQVVAGYAEHRGLPSCVSLHDLQSDVQGALPPFEVLDAKSEETIYASSATKFQSVLLAADSGGHTSNFQSISEDGLVKIKLFESFGECSGEYSVSSTGPSDSPMKSTSFSLKLPPFILWVDFHLVNLLMKLFKQVEDSFGRNCPKQGSESDITDVQHELSAHTEMINGSLNQIRSISSRGNFQGNILLPTARIVLCAALDGSRDSCRAFHWNKFISLEFSPLNLEEVQNATTVKDPQRTERSHSYTESSSVCLDVGNVDVYLVTTASENISNKKDRQLFSARKILSATSGTENRRSMATLLWQKGPVTGPWMERRAWNLAASQDSRSRNKAMGKGDEFASVTRAEDLVEASSQVRQEMVLSSAFLMHIHLSHVCGDISHHEYALLHVILNQILDISCQELDEHIVKQNNLEFRQPCETENIAQASLLIEIDSFDLSITLDEVEEVSKSLQRELSGSWIGLRLKVDKFELLSVSNIGGINGARFIWLSHGEGDLWGSICDINYRSTAATQEFLLISCGNSTLRRGDGGGGNVISYGPAGTSIAHLQNPQIHQAITSVTVRCGTIVAPGCRLDWFNTIFLFFKLPCHNDEAGDVHSQNATSNADADYQTSFFLDLVDIALSYEPQKMDGTEMGSDDRSADLNKASNQPHVACILAAASLNLCSHSGKDDYNIRLQDAGLLICQCTEPYSDRRYDVDYLRKVGYVKIAGDGLVESVIRTKCEDNLLWEVEFSDLHVNLDTCSDTTLGLICLLGQLQQLFAPDIEESLVHLQSRWSSAKQADNMPDKLSIYVSSETGYEIKQPHGLMDEVVDDIFFFQAGETLQSNSSVFSFNNNAMLREAPDLSLSHPKDIDFSSLNNSSSGPEPDIGLNNMQRSCVDETSLPEIIESYYIPEILPRANQQFGSCSPDEALKRQTNMSHRAVEGGKGAWYKNSSFAIVENHISNVVDDCIEKQLDNGDKEILINSIPSSTCKPSGRVLLKNTDVRWRMFGGSDWSGARKVSSESSNSTGRDEHACLELLLLGVNLQHDMYHDGELFVSKLALSIHDFHLYDCSRDAPWKMVVGYYSSKKHPRESSAKAFKLDLEAVRPDPVTPLEEYRLHIALLPLRLHLDQSQLDFLIRFFGGRAAGKPSDQMDDLDGQGNTEVKNSHFTKEFILEEALLPFFQKCDIRPVVVRVDYIPRYVDLAALRGGNYIELVNLVPWKGIDLHLKHVHAVGIYGWGGICETIVGEWLEDISQNQVCKVLKGLKPIRSLFSVSSGAAKLVSLPIKDYKNDRRLIKGIQRGAITFLRSLSVEAVGLGVHLAAGVHDILLQTEYILTGTPSLLPLSGQTRAEASVRSNQPKDVRQGMRQAYESLTDGLGRTASALVGTPLKTYQRGSGAGSALVSAIRAAPTAAVAPASSAARAVHCALLGVRNSLDREHKKESMEKYHGTSRSQDHKTW